MIDQPPSTASFLRRELSNVQVKTAVLERQLKSKELELAHAARELKKVSRRLQAVHGPNRIVAYSAPA